MKRDKWWELKQKGQFVAKKQGRKYQGLAEIAEDVYEAQKAALLSELALRPEPTIGKRVRCKMGVHGDTARPLNRVFRDAFGNISVLSTTMQRFFCVSCGKEWKLYKG